MSDSHAIINKGCIACYQCDRCQKKFSQKNALILHKRSCEVQSSTSHNFLASDVRDNYTTTSAIIKNPAARTLSVDADYDQQTISQETSISALLPGHSHTDELQSNESSASVRGRRARGTKVFCGYCKKEFVDISKHYNYCRKNPNAKPSAFVTSGNQQTVLSRSYADSDVDCSSQASNNLTPGTVVSRRNNLRHKKTGRPRAQVSSDATESNNKTYEMLDVDDEDTYVDKTERETLHTNDDNISEDNCASDNGRHSWRKTQYYVDCLREDLRLLREEHDKHISAQVADENEAVENIAFDCSDAADDTADDHERLKQYVKQLCDTLTDVSTRRCSPEVEELLLDCRKIDDERRKRTCPQEHLDKITAMTQKAKAMGMSTTGMPWWPWAWPKGSDMYNFHEKRLAYWQNFEMANEILWQCESCKASDLLFGAEIGSCMFIKADKSKCCHDCMALARCHKRRDEMAKAWRKVKPTSGLYPRRVDEPHVNEDLPDLSLADKAAMALVHPVVNVTVNSVGCKKLQQHCITLTQDPSRTWAHFLPRTDLSSCYTVIERVKHNGNKVFFAVNVDTLRAWLMKLATDHDAIKQMVSEGKLHISEDAFRELEKGEELAEVDWASEETPELQRYRERHAAVALERDHEVHDDVDEEGVAHASMHAVFSEQHAFSFERRKGCFHLKKGEVAELKKDGKIKFVEDSQQRKLAYNISPKLAFPHNYYEAGMCAPIECGDPKLAAALMRKQLLYPVKTADGRFRFWVAEDHIHMMHQYAAILEKQVNKIVGFHLMQHPETAAMPMSDLINILQQGADDTGIIDSKLPGLSQAMIRLNNSREFWWNERQGIEAISRDLGEPNLFVTFNMDARNWDDCRWLVYRLEKGRDIDKSEKESEAFKKWYPATDVWTDLMCKHASLVTIFLRHKFESFFKAFFCDICKVPEHQPRDDYTQRYEWSSPNNAWYWTRVEFTEIRGVQHHHCLVRLPYVLETCVLGRIVQDGRLIRQEVKFGNVKPECMDRAWQMIEMGLLAQQYVILLVDSLSSTACLNDLGEVIDIENLRRDFIEQYTAKVINKTTHPIMRRVGDPECDHSDTVEMAKIVAVSQIHQCMKGSCGGDEQTGRGCRFDYPKKLMPKTVLAMIRVNREQCEARVLTQRTHERVNNFNELVAKYWRANHDFTVLIDSAHAMRYSTKYASKSSKHSEMNNQLLDYLNKRNAESMPRRVRQVLDQVFLASASHRMFLSVLEVAYHAMQLPLVMKSFDNVAVEGCYWRANLIHRKDNVTVYSDRTSFAAYAERCDPETVCTAWSTQELRDMNFRDFCEVVSCRFVASKDQQDTPLTRKGQLRSRVQGTGHWVLGRRRWRRHVRFSTLVNTDLAVEYSPVDRETDASVTTFYELPLDRRLQLARSYYELVCYVPWIGHPDNTFLDESVLDDLRYNDPENIARWSLQRCERYHEVLVSMYRRVDVDGRRTAAAVSGSLWYRDVCCSYTRYLVNQHNNLVKIDRSNNEGKYNAYFEPAEELVGFDDYVQIKPALFEEADDDSYPSAEAFACDDFKAVLEQRPPSLQDIAVAFPTQHEWRRMEELGRQLRSKRFLAQTPQPRIHRDNLSTLQSKVVDIAVRGDVQVLYIVGVAGSGKSEVILHICSEMAKRGQLVQVCASTGKAATAFNGPTVHAAFGLSFEDSNKEITETSKKCVENRLFYENVDLFIIDEVNMLAAHVLGLIDDVMSMTFNAQHKNKTNLPFGGKRLILVGDSSQLPCVDGVPFYENKVTRPPTGIRGRREMRGKSLYASVIRPNVVMLCRNQRNSGLLAELAGRLREGKQTEDDLNILTLQHRKFADIPVDRGIHAVNDATVNANWRTLWHWCQQHSVRMHVVRAEYHNTDNNQLVVDALSCLSGHHYDYAPHLLCVAVGCEVRLVKNLDVEAGLVNSAVGTVVKILFDNADVKHVLEGKHPSPHCIIVDFPDFRGYVGRGDDDRFPFPARPTWVPVYKLKFTISKRELPRSITDKQDASLCWRYTFPLDLGLHLTAHRAQGCTMRDCRVFIDLGLANPTSKLPKDAAKLAYVAITRPTSLKYVFAAPIASVVWNQLNKGDDNQAHLLEEQRLRNNAIQFALREDIKHVVIDEFDWKPDYSNNALELQQLQRTVEPPPAASDHLPSNFDNDQFNAQCEGVPFRFVAEPARSQRFIGLDQGTAHFAMCVVDTYEDRPPKLVSAKLLTSGELRLPTRFTANNVVLALTRASDLTSWMQLDPNNPPAAGNVDRVVVCVERMSEHNANAKKFGVDLARALQRLVPDPLACVVKMSSPNLHCAGGVAFRLGDKIVHKLNLRPLPIHQASRVVDIVARRKRNHVDDNNVNDDVSTSRDDEGEARLNYRQRKQISAAVFKYIVTADAQQLSDMHIDVDDYVKARFAHLSEHEVLSDEKLDDLGDALLHALHDILCGSSNYRQALPTAAALHSNRTVAVSVFPSTLYWCVIQCSWNALTVEAMGSFPMVGERGLYISEHYINRLVKSINKGKIAASRDLGVALKDFQGCGLYAPTDHIKVIVKQQREFQEAGLVKRKEAGGISNAAVCAMERICDKAMPKSSQLMKKKDRKTGAVYLRTCRTRALKYQVCRSTGKHTNAVLSCLHWFQTHEKGFVENRNLHLNESGKRKFFTALQSVAKNDKNNLEMIRLSTTAKTFLSCDSAITKDKMHVRNFADLILIAINKNQTLVKAAAANYRKSAHFNVADTNK